MAYIGKAVIITLGEFLNDQPPIVPIYYTSSSACLDGIVTLSTDSFLTYQWQYSTNGASYVGITGANTSSFNVSYSVNGAGYYRVRVTVADTGGDFYSGPAIVSFYDLPAPTVLGTMTAHISTVLSTQSYLSYQWIKDGADINGATAQTYVATESGNYAVRVTESHGALICTGTSSNVLVTIYGPAVIIVTPNLIGPPTLEATWPGENITDVYWFINNIASIHTTEVLLIPTVAGDYKVALSTGTSTTITPSVTVGLSYEPWLFELNVLGSVGQGGALDRYTDIVFEITERLGRAFPVSYINFFVYQNGSLHEDLTKNSPYTSYEEIPNGWHFIINGPSNLKYKFKSGSAIEIRVVVSN